MIQSRGQITVFIIIGIALLFIIGAAMYLTSTSERQQLELAKPRVSEIPERAQPVRDAVETCLLRIGEDALRRAGESGGYVDWGRLKSNPFDPTEGDAVQMAPYTDPPIAYWWHMKSKNSCKSECDFVSERPPLYESQGANSIEAQVTSYVEDNLPACVPVGEYQGCTIRTRGTPNVQTRITQTSVGFLADYDLTVNCEDQVYTLEDYYTETDLNLAEMYEIATNLTNYQATDGILEQATTTIISTFSGVDRNKLPPFRDLEFGAINPGTFWIKYEILTKLKEVLSSYIPGIQVLGTKGYQYAVAPEGTRDPELYETLYNRQFAIPLNKSYPDLSVRFSYLDWWPPYFDLNCNGQLCRADSGTNFYILPFSINRYEFAYDLSFPVLVEIRNPNAFNGKGYSFKFMLEQNMRNSARFKTDTKLLEIPTLDFEPSIFCNPEQRTSGTIRINIKDGKTLRPVDEAGVAYVCGEETCTLGTARNGTLISQFPSCIGGTLLITKPEYVNAARKLDTISQEPREIAMTIEPIRTLKATVKNYQISKLSKREPWEYIATTGLVRPNAAQETLVMMNKQVLPDEEPFFAYANIKGGSAGEIRLAPGRYTISIVSLLKDKITIPSDERCFTMRKFASKSEECYKVPEKPIYFNQSQPFPLGSIEYDFEIRPDDLREATAIEFRQFVLGIDKVPEEERIVEDLGELQKGQLYAENNPILIWPVITK